MESGPPIAATQEALRAALSRHQAGDLEQAEKIYRQVLAAEPDNTGALHLLGVVALQTGKLGDAVALLEKAVRLKDTDPFPLNNLGNAYGAAARYADAAECFRRAIALKPDYVDAHINLGNALAETGRLEESEHSYRRALQLAPGDSRIHLNLGKLLRDRGRLVESERSYREAAALQPGNAEAHYALGNALRDLGQHEAAVQSYRRALVCKQDFSEALQNLIMMLDFVEGCGTAEQQKERRLWYRQIGFPHRESIRPHRNLPDPERRLRIGYVSADFRRHSAYYLFGPVIALHDRAAFEVVCYSGTGREDDATDRMRRSADVWRPALNVPDEELAETVRRDGIDILVDLAGHTYGNRLTVFAGKPAPVQITAWGYVTGTGMPAMDYLFADPVLLPEDERQYFAEEVIDLPCCVCYEAPEYAPEVAPPPSLDGGPFTFGCINRFEKISGRALALWERILAAVPDATILVKEHKLDDPGIRERLLDKLARHGIPREKVRLLGKTSHLANLETYHQVDVALDPFPHGGGVSSMEAMWMGVPVITLLGATVPARLGAAILTGMGMQDWIARDDDEYVRKAVELAGDRRRLAGIRRELRTRMARSVLGDVQAYTRSVERTYRALWRRWCERPVP